MKYIKESKDCECPYCSNNLYKYVWNPQNIISISDRYDYYGADDFQLFRDAYYKCPYCEEDFYIRIRSSDNIFKKFT